MANNSFSYASALGFNIPGWTLFGRSGLISPTSAFSAPAALDGSQVAFLQSPGGSFWQTISLPTNGLYTLQYYIAGRPGGGNVTYNVLLDSSILISNATTTSGQAFTLQTASFTNTLGSHLLVFTNTASGDNTAFFDFVQVNGGTNIISLVPANIDCTNAIALTNNLSYSENTSLALLGGGMSDSCSSGISHGVWYKVTPPINERVKIGTTGSSFPTQLAVYTGTCGALTNIVCNNGSSYYGALGSASADFSSPGNVTYYVLVGGYQGASGNLVITATLTNPPANDVCTGAIDLTNGLTYAMDTSFATEIGDTNVGCGAGIGHGVWFTLAGFAGQPITISTCGSTYGTDLVVYTNACGSLGTPFICSSGSNPSFCAGNFAGVSFISPTNTTYYILASGVGSASGTLQITANLPPPTNDVCLYAIPMTNGVTYTTTNIYATSIGDPVPSCVPSFGRGIWYSYTPSVSGLVGVTTCGSSFQTALSVYTGVCGSLTNEVACSHNSGAYCNSGNADVNFYGTNGTTYYILVGGVNGAAGTLQILIPVVDLVSAGLTATNPTGGLLTAGRNFNATWTVQNQGVNPIYGIWTDSLSLSNASTNLVLASFTSAHTAGSYSQGGVNIPLPQIPAGTYALIAQADIGNAVVETNKLNNIQTVTVTVTNIPPAITLLSPTNQISRESCVAVPFKLLAQTVAGSYTITNVIFYDNDTLMIGQKSNAPYLTASLALNIGSHTITAKALDNFGLSGTSTNLATITLYYPTNLNLIRVDLDTNRDFVGCMCAQVGSNYIFLTTTNLASTNWLPYSTNLAITNIVAFTNSPSDKARFFRALRLP